MDHIIIKDLEIYAYHGVYAEEKEKGQHFYLCADLVTDTRKAGETDDLSDSTSYGDVARLLDRVVRSVSYDLLERVAEVAAKEILLTFPGIREVTLEVKKPEAPIKLPFDYVSVRITRGWHKSYLGVGSNMGDKKEHIDAAIEALSSDPMIRFGKCSSLIVTKPYGGVEQDDFLNGAVEIDTLYTPEELLDKLHEIEASRERTREIHWGPRTLDLDILLYDDLILHTPDLIIPHADMHNRDFVLTPLKEIAPYALHPVFEKRIISL